MIHPDAQLEVSRYLEPDESLIWAGVPKRGLMLRASDLFLIPFSLLWGGFAIFWEWNVLQSDAPIIMPLFGAFFVAIGLYFIVGRFFVDAAIRARTCYGLTDRRVIILSGLLARSVKSLLLPTLHDVSLVERSDSTGTISFGPPSQLNSMAAGMSWPGLSQYQVPTFEFIANARQVHDQLLSAQREASASSG